MTSSRAFSERDRELMRGDDPPLVIRQNTYERFNSMTEEEQEQFLIDCEDNGLSRFQFKKQLDNHCREWDE